MWKVFQFFILLTFGENFKVFEEKNWFWGQISDLWKIFGFGDNFGFWETFWILDEISNFQNINFFGKKLGFCNFFGFFLEMSCISEWFRFSDVFWGGFQFFWTNCRNSSWNLWTNFIILTKKKLDLWKKE